MSFYMRLPERVRFNHVLNMWEYVSISRLDPNDRIPGVEYP